MVHIVLREKQVATTQKKNYLHFWRIFSANHNQARTNLNQKRLKWVQIWNKRLRFLFVDDFSNISISLIISINFNKLITSQFTVNLQKNMTVLISNDGIQWTLKFGPDSVTIAVIDLVQKIKISPQETPQAARQLLLSQRQDFLDNHLPRDPIAQNEEGTKEMRHEVLSSVGFMIWILAAIKYPVSKT